jgi:hypothetical protein
VPPAERADARPAGIAYRRETSARGRRLGEARVKTRDERGRRDRGGERDPSVSGGAWHLVLRRVPDVRRRTRDAHAELNEPRPEGAVTRAQRRARAD